MRVSHPEAPPSVVIVGGGPAGLMAAEVLVQANLSVTLYDAMPSLGRKLLLAGVGGLNLTHAEPHARFLTRYGDRQQQLQPWLASFGPEQLRAWAQELGIPTFVGSSGRVFPQAMKAAPLLRAWLQRLRRQGLQIRVRHRWQGWDSAGALYFDSPAGPQPVVAQAVILALGGGSYARLGSDAAWLPILRARGVEIAELQPANCGFDVAWSEHFRSRFAGQPLKRVQAWVGGPQAAGQAQLGELLITQNGVEGSLIYALSAALRQLSQTDTAPLHLDLMPHRTRPQLAAALARPAAGCSLANRLRRAGLTGVRAALLREFTSPEVLADATRLAAAAKALPVPVLRPRPLSEAISSAGGVRFEALDSHLMLRALPGVFCAGEMLDWEAPTGGYLLTACCASGRAAARGVLHWLARA